jgi:hypothetical protein
MVSEEQEEANEERKRRAEENGDQVLEVRNSDGGIENLMVEKKPEIDDELGAYTAVAAGASPPGPPGGSGGGYGGDDISRIRKKYLVTEEARMYEPSLSEVIRAMDDSPWYKKAWNHTKAFFAGRSYEDIIIEDKTKEIDAELSKKQARYREIRAEYQKERDDLKRTDQEAKVLGMQYDRIVSRIEKSPDPMLAVHQKEVMDEIEYQNEIREMCKTRITSHYEPTLNGLGAEILELRKAKLHLNKILEDFHSRKTEAKDYTIQKCSV